MQQFEPGTILRPFIKAFRIIESDMGMVNRLLPDTALALAFRIKGDIVYTEDGATHHLPAAVITGIRTSSRVVDYSKNTATLLVIFNEGGAAAFFKQPLHELSGISVSLDDLITPSKLQQVEEQLALAADRKSHV